MWYQNEHDDHVDDGNSEYTKNNNIFYFSEKNIECDSIYIYIYIYDNNYNNSSLIF